MQDRFAVQLCAASKGMGIHTAIETNGYLGDRLSDAELGRMDLVLLGIKTWGAERHRDLTGKDIEPTLDFARRLAASEAAVWVRFVLVPGLTDDPETSRDRPFAAGPRQRGARRSAALPPDGPVQVGAARPRLHASAAFRHRRPTPPSGRARSSDSQD